MDKETKRAWIIVGCLALAVVLFFGGKTIYTEYKNQQQQTQTLIQQQQQALDIANQRIQDTQSKANEENKKLQNQVTTLQNKKPETIIKEVPAQASSSNSLATSLINQIEPIVVEVNCYSADLSMVSMGSGTSVKIGNSVWIVTNYHVFAGAYSGNQPPAGCYAVYPMLPNFTYNENYGDYHLKLLYSHYNPDTYQDSATFELGEPLRADTALNYIPVVNDLPLTGLNSACPDNVNVGDSLTIFGYPKSGNLLGISETVTGGIVSGIIAGPIYKTDAPIDHGNSGGLTILNKNNCVLGIPTLGESGLTAGIGYIQSIELALKNN